MEENCSTDWYFTKIFLDFVKHLRQNFHHRTHIQRGQPKGGSRNITFPNITITMLFKFHISSFTFYIFHRPLLIIAKLLDIIENQILKAINHIKYISKKNPCTLEIFNYLQNNYASNYDFHSVEVKLNELKPNGIIDDRYKIIKPIQKIMNFVTEDEVTIYSENIEDESSDPHRTATSPKIIGPEITTQVENMSTTQVPKESDINLAKLYI